VRRLLTIGSFLAVVGVTCYVALAGGVAQAQQKKTGHLFLRGDTAYFLGIGKPKNCTINNVFRHGDPVGWRIEAVDPETGQHVEPEAKLVVHISYGGKMRDLPMHWAATAAAPNEQFWVAKWIVPDDAPTGIVKYTVSATDKYGRTGEYKPFDVESSQLTIVQ